MCVVVKIMWLELLRLKNRGEHGRFQTVWHSASSSRIINDVPKDRESVGKFLSEQPCWSRRESRLLDFIWEFLIIVIQIRGGSDPKSGGRWVQTRQLWEFWHCCIYQTDAGESR